MDIQKLHQYGLLFPVSSGIQVDINAIVKNDGSEGSTCDHNCTLEVGDYDCPAAFTLNKGMNKKFAPAEKIIDWVTRAAGALIRARQRFVDEDATEYFNKCRVPGRLHQSICSNITAGKVEVNLFGGNPEMHAEVTDITPALQARGYAVNLTTTGRRFLTDSAYTNRTVQSPPNLVALSADYLDLERFEYLSGLDLDPLKGAWKQVNPLHGQKQKFVEAIYTSRLFAGMSSPRILYNMVVHPGNLRYVEELIGSIHAAFPNNMVNPYPAQSSFLYEANIFGLEHLKEFERFVDLMIVWSKDPTSPITKRLHYWLVLKAVLETHRGNSARALEMLSGYDTWRCYRNPVLPYLQIGRGMLGSTEPNVVPGGKLGCFWNDQTVSQESPIETAAQADGYLLTSMRARAQESANPCRGCLMPRLMFNFLTTEMGLDPALLPAYFELRKEHVGF